MGGELGDAGPSLEEAFLTSLLLVPVVGRNEDCRNHCRAFNILKTTTGLPSGPGVMDPPPGRGPMFDPWSGRILPVVG